VRKRDKKEPLFAQHRGEQLHCRWLQPTGNGLDFSGFSQNNKWLKPILIFSYSVPWKGRQWNS